MYYRLDESNRHSERLPVHNVLYLQWDAYFYFPILVISMQYIIYIGLWHDFCQLKSRMLIFFSFSPGTFHFFLQHSNTVAIKWSEWWAPIYIDFPLHAYVIHLQMEQAFLFLAIFQLISDWNYRHHFLSTFSVKSKKCDKQVGKKPFWIMSI